jgi:hypothetical protein
MLLGNILSDCFAEASSYSALALERNWFNKLATYRIPKLPV